MGSRGTDANPPIYYLLMHLFGAGDIAVRIPSMIGVLGSCRAGIQRFYTPKIRLLEWRCGCSAMAVAASAR